MYDYARGLVSLGHDVTVFTTDALDENRFKGPMEENVSGIKVIRFRNLSNTLAWKKKRFLPLSFAGHLRRTAMNYDFIIMTDTRNYQNLITYRQCKKENIPYGMCCFGSLPRRKEGLKTLYDRFFVSPMISRAKWLFAQTANEMNEYRKFGGGNGQIKLLPLPVELPDAPTEHTLYDKLRLIFVGRIHYLKGLQNIVAALSLIKDKVDFEMNIVGRDDGYLDEILHQIKTNGLDDKVKFLGSSYGAEKEHLILSSNIFIITPLIFEETSTAALEAASLGCAVLSTPQSDIPYLKEYDAGIIIDNNPEKISAGLIYLAGNLQKVSAMGKNARKLMEENFEVKKVVKIIDNCLRSAQVRY